MSGFLVIALFLCLLKDGVYEAKAWNDADFFSYCPPSRCSKHGPEIRYPFRLVSNNTSPLCGVPCMKLACSGNDTTLVRPPAVILTRTSAHGCALDYAMIVSCLREFTLSDSAANYIFGPISCLTSKFNFSYLVDGSADVSVLPLDCKVLPDSDSSFPMDLPGSTLFKEQAEAILNFCEKTIDWWYYESGDYNPSGDVKSNCTNCELDRGRCGFSPHRNQTICVNHGPHINVIAATSAAAASVVLLLIVAAALHRSLKKRYNEIYLTVEMFLKSYGTSKPTRYTFAEVKKITRRFKEKVGQGGFGSVYKGELPIEVPVAVKMLENSVGEGEEFINEVATIRLFHHANIVRLLGFCSEGTRRALIYEFMPNESWEKYIFSHDSSISQELLVPKKMVKITLGIARGMEYLHQGCNKRILHFDIKPQNILLDYNFNPKISDFGLAKLCARDQSIVTLTAERGTMGYIAPEQYSQNFGGVSYKSDVYSFGMMVLEMISGRRNIDPSVHSQNEVYLPEWIFEKLTIGQDLTLGVDTEMNVEQNEQMGIVALWCFQWNPRNRPSMIKVVNMLTGRLENLRMPPKPFASSERHEMP
ncbi:hypothetical protein BS78_03G157500 [Paspalum vaginatum]|nr:hypothetical protein BS78_03G157500 [Paspalum vaginatum]